MLRISDITSFLKDTAPPSLAEEWDNVGLLLGNRDAAVSAVLTCLTLTPDVAAEAIDRGAQLVISHHPVLFRPVQRLTDETVEGQMLLELVAAGIGVYSPHTGYDSAKDGINRQLAALLELGGVSVLRPQATEGPAEETPAGQTQTPSERDVVGAGRFGNLPAPMSLRGFCGLVKERLRIDRLQYVGDAAAVLTRVGIACGAAAEFLSDAGECGCQALLTGEARFHACLEARALGIALVLPGHYATERPAMEHLADVLAGRFSDLTVWASECESDPIQWG